MYRCVIVSDGKVKRYIGPYRTAAPAKAAATNFSKAPQYEAYVETCNPEWVRVE